MVTKKEYSEMSKKASPNSRSWVNVPMAFVHLAKQFSTFSLITVWKRKQQAHGRQ